MAPKTITKEGPKENESYKIIRVFVVSFDFSFLYFNFVGTGYRRPRDSPRMSLWGVAPPTTPFLCIPRSELGTQIGGTSL